jgi:hypothetical protein
MVELEPVNPMRAGRKVLVSLLVAVIVAGHLYDGLRDNGPYYLSHWPFHSFHMFSTLSRARHVAVRRIMGVDQAGNDVSLSDPAYSEPILIYHVRLKFDRAFELRKGRCEALRKMSQEYLARYERHRKAGRHAGPLLAGLRLYEFRWNHVESWAQHASQADQKIVLFDSTLPCNDSPPTAPKSEENGGRH